ncbi:hypothetical protein [Aureivirga sp. CE67]|uniref:hypothetical protein n=1 Tax=Aureivirga sp. CE67 TaxID=1788983 RepID=UPI0018C8F8A4|nr:hypothetical protein [Aureivirga sp. CE67]
MRKPCYLFLLIFFLNISCSSDDDNHTNNETVSDAFFMLNNLNDENQLIYFNRNLNSKLEIVGSYGTKGSGGNLDPFREFGVTADPNGSQGSVNFAQNNKFVLNVNNFDSSFSVFKIHPDKLEFITKQNTDFEYPNSIASAKNVVYILHLFGGLQGFKIDENGGLTPIPNAKHQFDSSAIGYVNVSINDSATKLIVTTLSDKAYIISLDENGEFTSIEENDALRPFGSIFITEDVVAITRARLGSVGIYRINENNKLILLSEENTEVRGLCWFKTDRLKNYLYGSNTPEGKIFKFNIQNFTQEVPLVTESTPPPSRNTVIQGEDTIRYYIFLDLVVTDHYLYVIDPLNERIDSYKIETNGSLTYDTNTSFKDRPIINTISGGFNGFSN